MSDQKLPKAGVELIKEFEGCRLTAYPDPLTGGKPYTVGWGSTINNDGRPFVLGEKITQEEADELLEWQLSTAYFPVISKQIPYFSSMSPEQQGALLSFAYNLGAHFYGSEGFETISRRLRNKEWDLVPTAFMLYVNPGSSVEAGLRRRRKAEGDLWTKGLNNQTTKQEIVALRDTLLKKRPVQSYELASNERIDVQKGKTYQIIKIVNEGAHSKVTLEYGAGVWYIYNPHWETRQIGGVVKAPETKILSVKYFPQRDSATTHALRMCFSSSCAMLADYLDPNAIKVAEQEDDYYMNKYVFKYGDTTSADAQIKALRDLGIKAEFRKNLSPKALFDQIKANIPVPIGILHHGPINAPRGGGHWILVIGYDNTTNQWIVHDPYGELDLLYGGYPGSTNGASQRYSYKNLNKRWEVEGHGTGWGIIATR